MSAPNFYNRSCPEPVPVSLTQNFLSLSGEQATIAVYSKKLTGTELQLPHTPLVGVEIKVFVNGLLQEPGAHYDVLAGTGVISFHNALSNDDVQVSYAHLVT